MVEPSLTLPSVHTCHRGLGSWEAVAPAGDGAGTHCSGFCHYCGNTTICVFPNQLPLDLGHLNKQVEKAQLSNNFICISQDLLKSIPREIFISLCGWSWGILQFLIPPGCRKNRISCWDQVSAYFLDVSNQLSSLEILMKPHQEETPS